MECRVTKKGDLFSLFTVPFVPQKIVLDPLCEIFEEGNRICNVKQKQLILDDDDSADEPQTVKQFPCIESSCKAVFTSLRSCEIHYACTHRYACVQCKRVFPNQPTLDVHIQDFHNPCVGTGEGTVLSTCFVVLCAEQFSSVEERNEHVIRDHKYPSDFRFGILRGIKKEDRDKMDTTCPSDDASCSKPKYEPKVPLNICFGRGSSKAFKRRGQAFSRRKNQSLETKETRESENDITMTELLDTLE